MSLIESLKTLFKRKPIRLRLEDVMPNDLVAVEWSRFKEGVGFMLCVNNDPKTKKILLSVKWNNHKEANLTQVESMIVGYYDKMFKNFNLLNYHLSKESKATLNFNDFDMDMLKSRLEIVLEQEIYEDAKIIQSLITLKEYLEKPTKINLVDSK